MCWPDYVLLALVAICAARAFGVWRRSMKSGNCCGCSGDCTPLYRAVPAAARTKTNRNTNRCSGLFLPDSDLDSEGFHFAAKLVRVAVKNYARHTRCAPRSRCSERSHR